MTTTSTEDALLDSILKKYGISMNEKLKVQVNIASKLRND